MVDGGWIGKYAFQDDALAADDIGRAAIADEFFAATAGMRAKFEDGFITNSQIADSTIELAKLASSKLLRTGVYGLTSYGSAVYG